MGTVTDVLVVGAGPTGLVAALCLVKSRVRLRIVDARSGPGQASRAMAVQARTLELYDQLGLADAVVAGGVPIRAVHLHEGGREVASVDVGEIGHGLSPFPFVLAYPQDDHERLLVERLRTLGVEVEWSTELVEVDEAGHAVLVKDGVRSACDASWVIGADGAHSRVRHALGIGFPGGTYEEKFFVADVVVEGGFDRDVHASLAARDLALMLPCRKSGTQRIVGLLPEELASSDECTFEDVRPTAEKLVGRRVTDVRWFSSYRVHHRVAEHFRAGRCFLAGDAGHVHSPVGGQGMNTGIGDAVNLAWKIASVLSGEGHESLLDSYEVERIAFARKLVGTTDRIFTRVAGRHGENTFIRTWLVPHVASLLSHVTSARKLIFATVSQTRIHYHDSPLSEGHAGDVRGGDRLPWEGDNFAPLKSRAFQIHTYGATKADFGGLGLPVHAMPWTDGSPFARGAAYVVRPDGYVALAAESPHEVRDWARSRGFEWAR